MDALRTYREAIMVNESKLPAVNFADPRLGREVERYLREASMSGAFKPGERVGLNFLAEKLGVSTMPVREALVALTNEGLFELQPNRGFRVAQITKADVEDLFIVHSLVAGLLAERAATRMTDEKLKELSSVQGQLDALPGRRMTGAERAAEAEVLNWRFHRLINQADPESNRLRWFVRLASRFVPPNFYDTVEGWLESTLNDHPPLLAAIEDRNPGEARRLMEEHTRNAGQQILTYLESSGMWDDAAGASST